MYITVDEIKQRFKTDFDSVDEQFLLNQIELISNEIDEYCNTRFEPTPDIYALDYKRKFFTRKQPLIRVSNLLLNQTELLEDKEFYVYIEKSRIEITELEVENTKKAIVIDYIYGYEKIPSTVKQVLFDLLKLDKDTESIKFSNIQSENFDGEYSYTLNNSKDFTPTELRKNIMKRLDIFKVKPYIETTNNRIVNVRLL